MRNHSRRALFALDWDYGPWAVTGRMNYIGSTKQDLLPASWFAVQNPGFDPTTLYDWQTYDVRSRQFRLAFTYVM